MHALHLSNSQNYGKNSEKTRESRFIQIHPDWYPHETPLNAIYNYIPKKSYEIPIKPQLESWTLHAYRCETFCFSGCCGAWFPGLHWTSLLDGQLSPKQGLIGIGPWSLNPNLRLKFCGFWMFLSHFPSCYSTKQHGAWDQPSRFTALL